MPTRRQFLGSVGAGLLLAPFIDVGLTREARASSIQAKRLLIFCTMGTYPPLWTPTGISAASATKLRKNAQRSPLTSDAWRAL